MSHFLQDVIQLSLFLGLAGNKEGDKIPFRFFSLLYKVLMDLDGKTSHILMMIYGIIVVIINIIRRRKRRTNQEEREKKTRIFLIDQIYGRVGR